MKLAAKSDIGLKRENNQDSYSFGEILPGVCYAIVCDGMGGAQAGEIASQLSNKCFTKYIYERLLTHTGSRTAYELILKCSFLFCFEILVEEQDLMRSFLVK